MTPALARARFAWTSAQKDLRRRLADPAALALWLGIPVLLGALMSLVFGGGGGGTPRVRVLVADLDGGLVSRLLGGGRGAQADLPLELETVELEAGRARMEAGDASALLVLPDGFAAALLREEPVRLELVTNPAHRIGPELARTALEMLRELVFYAHRLFGEELREIAAGPPASASFFDDARAAEIAARVNRRVRSLDRTLFPPVLRLELEREAGDEEGGAIDVGLLLLPGLVFMSLLFIANGMSEDLWAEKEQGTLRRARVAPQGLAPFLAGKAGAGAAVMAAAAALGLALVAATGSIDAAMLPLALLWCSFCGVALLCIFLCVQLLASSRRGASVLSMSVLFPMMMLGGSLFPLGAMPAWMASVGRFLPNGRGALVLRSMLEGGLAPAELARGAACVALPGALAFVLALRLLRTRFATS